VIVPELPEPFLVEFLPAVVSQLGAAAPAEAGMGAGRPSVRRRGVPSSAGIGVRVVDVGEWTLRTAERVLRASAGIADDVALQISLPAQDFTPLIVEPTRRALAAHDGSGAGSELLARTLWARFGRFDEEAAELLRQQQGRILVRIEDAGTLRRVALTPGLLAYSLETAECTVDCSLAALLELQEKRKNPLDLFYEGRIRIAGDAQIALALAGLFL
jgi:hypothetical protein